MLFYALSWGDYKDDFPILTNSASVIENVHHTQTPCPPPTYSLDCSETRTALDEKLSVSLKVRPTYYP